MKLFAAVACRTRGPESRRRPIGRYDAAAQCLPRHPRKCPENIELRAGAAHSAAVLRLPPPRKPFHLPLKHTAFSVRFPSAAATCCQLQGPTGRRHTPTTRSPSYTELTVRYKLTWSWSQVAVLWSLLMLTLVCFFYWQSRAIAVTSCPSSAYQETSIHR